MKDPIVEEIRKVRNEHARKFDFNLHEICKDLRFKEKASGHNVVTFPPKKLVKNV